MNTKHYIIIIAVVIAIFAIPLIIFPNAPYGGADSAAEEAISGRGYTPWFTPLWEPPSGEIESLLFALQAAIGAMIIGYFVGYERGKRAKKEIKETETAQ
ncbi:energy-coupling factor ABC transporter substrate-binding protein [Candidatus Bathyarchaeota archaeon A05DMB-2]|jgi:cobalt/nickel transport protein|nr:energy-coupling factor ABC transporter substrate-binding protein [Candidatus Bathyarchaeota archaeon A05DMB-2]